MLQFAVAKIATLVTANAALRAKDIDYLLRQSEVATIVTISRFRSLDYVATLDENFTQVHETIGNLCVLCGLCVRSYVISEGSGHRYSTTKRR